MSKSFSLQAYDEFMSAPIHDDNWIVDKILIESGISLLVAGPKDGKSTFALHLAKAVVTGSDFLGYSTKKGPVIYLALEDIRAELQRNLQKLNLPAGCPLHLFCGSVAWKEKELVAQAIERIKPSLVVIDTLARFMDLPDFNDYALISSQLPNLTNMARNSTCHILVIHHTNKSENVGGGKILGSTGLFAGVDSAIFLRRDKDVGSFETHPRYGEKIKGHSFQYQDGEIVSLGGSEERGTDAALAKIKEVLTISDKPLSEDEIKNRISAKTAYLKNALKDLRRSGLIARMGRGTKGDPYKYALVNPSSRANPPYNGNHNFEPDRLTGASL